MPVKYVPLTSQMRAILAELSLMRSVRQLDEWYAKQKTRMQTMFFKDQKHVQNQIKARRKLLEKRAAGVPTRLTYKPKGTPQV